MPFSFLASMQMSYTTWSTVEFSIVRALALQVRAMTSTQVARGWFANCRNPKKAAKAALRRLELAGLVTRETVEAPVPQRLSRPLFQWKVGSHQPTDALLSTVAECGRKRCSLPHTRLATYRASSRACRVFGSFAHAGHSRACEIGHDLHLAEVFIFYKEFMPALAPYWHGEGAFPKLGFDIRGMKDPDALLVDETGRGRGVIELVGSYEVDHLRAFHAHCAGGGARRLRFHRGLRRVFPRLYSDEGTGYELW